MAKIKDIITIDIKGATVKDKGPFPATLDGFTPVVIQELKDSKVLIMHDGVWCWNRVEDNDA